MNEAAFIESLRALATDEAARSLRDDAAVLRVGAEALVLTHDLIVEGIHYRPDDPPDDVAWKLLAVNLSDLAAKGARPLGVLLGYALGDGEWDQGFVRGLATALRAFDTPLLGGDTVAVPSGAPRALGLTAIGLGQSSIPGRDGARAGDDLWVTGSIGDAGAGLRLLDGGADGPAGLIERYRQPRPRLEAGALLAPMVEAMMDVSDGLLIDANRMAAASGCALSIALDALPMSADLLALEGDDLAARLAAATAGDDYELLFALPPSRAHAVIELGERLGLPFTRVGRFAEGCGMTLTHAECPVALPARLGFEHRTDTPEPR